MNNLEDIYDQALTMLKQGHTKDEVLLKFAQFKSELTPLLGTSSLLFGMPKKTVPTPMMNRKYMKAPAKSLWLAWFHISRFAGISVSLALLLSVLSITGYAAYNSAPGNTLFAVRKSAEKVEVLLAYNQNQKASLQIAIANQRLSDAQKIFNDPQSNDAQKSAALNELADQTSAAIATVKTAASANPKADSTHPLLNSLDDLTSQQQNLLAQIKPDSKTQSAAQSALLALNQSTSQLSEIKQSVSVADDSQTLTALSTSTNSQVISGTITKLSDKLFTVSKTDISIDNQTAVLSDDGQKLDSSALQLQQNVSVSVQKQQDLFVAKQITITDATSTVAGKPDVKGVSTSSNTTLTATATTQSLSSEKKPDDTSTGSATTTTTTPDPNTATGLYIYESPSPQYQP